MRVLQVNKFFFPEYGTEKYWFALMDALETHGHGVIHFSMAHPKNRPSKYSRYFVSNVDYSENKIGWLSLKKWFRMIYSWEARKNFGALLEATKPDLVHIHSIHHQISPSILSEAKRRGIPIVQTLHDHKLVCPAYHFPFRNGRVCTDCRRGRWLHLLLHRAHKNSLLATAAVVLESGIHSLTRIYERQVDRFIVPSRDMAQRLVEFGVSPKALEVVPHHIDLDAPQAEPNVGRGILFAGRLSSERGLDHLLAVATAFPNETIWVAGDGPERLAFEAKIKMRQLTNLKLLGRVGGEQLKQLFRSCRLVFYPSLTLETFGLTVLEAMAAGKPVVATRLGAVGELIQEDKTGFMYEPTNLAAGIAAIRRLLSNDYLAQQMGQVARQKAEQYTLEKNYSQIMEVYRDVLTAQRRELVEKMFAPEAAQI